VRYDSIDGQYQVKYDVRVSDDGILPTNLDGWYYNFIDENNFSRSPHSFTADPWSGEENPNDTSLSGWHPTDSTPEGFAQGIMWRLGKTYIFDQSPTLSGNGTPINGGPLEEPSSFVGCGTRAIYFGATEGGVGKIADVNGSDTTVGKAGCSDILLDSGGSPVMLPAPWVEYVWVLRDPAGVNEDREYWVSRRNGERGGQIVITNGYDAFQKYQINWNTYEGNPSGDVADDFEDTRTVISRKVIFNVPETLDETSDPYSTSTVPAFINRLHRRAMIVDSAGQIPDDGPTIDDIVRANRYARTMDTIIGEDPEDVVINAGNAAQKFQLGSAGADARQGWKDESSHQYSLKDVEEFLRGTGTYSLVIKMGFANGPPENEQGLCVNTSPSDTCDCDENADLCGGVQGQTVDREYPIIGPIRPSRSKRIIKPGVGGCGSLRLLQKDIDIVRDHEEGGGANGGGAFISWGQTVNDAVASL
jgi:hypothetical protein